MMGSSYSLSQIAISVEDCIDLLLSGVSDIAIATGAFCGAMVFLVGAVDYGVWSRGILFIVSFLIGIGAADFSSKALTLIINFNINIEPSLGAVFSSAFAVRILMLFSGQMNDKSIFMNIFKRMK